METYPEMMQMLELVYKGFEAIIINMIKNLKENMVVLMGNLGRIIETVNQEPNRWENPLYGLT